MKATAKPLTEFREYTLNGVKSREEMVPSLWVVVETYTPSGSIIPYDHYGGMWCRRVVKALQLAGIVGFTLTTQRSLTNPMGSGPGGRVRMGDNMLPYTYRLVVIKYDLEAAQRVLAELDHDIQLWLFEGGSKPLAVS